MNFRKITYSDFNYEYFRYYARKMELISAFLILQTLNYTFKILQITFSVEFKFSKCQLVDFVLNVAFLIQFSHVNGFFGIRKIIFLIVSINLIDEFYYWLQKQKISFYFFYYFIFLISCFLESVTLYLGLSLFTQAAKNSLQKF